MLDCFTQETDKWKIVNGRKCIIVLEKKTMMTEPRITNGWRFERLDEFIKGLVRDAEWVPTQRMLVLDITDRFDEFSQRELQKDDVFNDVEETFKVMVAENKHLRLERNPAGKMILRCKLVLYSLFARIDKVR